MSDPYVPRHPRTGEPLRSATHGRRKRPSLATPNPDAARHRLHPEQILPLATGGIEDVVVDHSGRMVRLSRTDGVRALVSLHGRSVDEVHAALQDALADADPAVRIAALEALPICAQQRSEALFHALHDRLDDEDLAVRKAASACLTAAATTFPAATERSLRRELRHELAPRRQAAWSGLRALLDRWPEVAMSHMDELLREDDVGLRRDAAVLLRRLIPFEGAMLWDLIQWALEDPDDEVRSKAARALPSLAAVNQRVTLILTERSLFDPNEDVRRLTLAALRRLDTSPFRLRSLAEDACRHRDAAIRRAGVELLNRMLTRPEMRARAAGLLCQETDRELRERLVELATDEELEGSAADKNHYLAPPEGGFDLDAEGGAPSRLAPLEEGALPPPRDEPSDGTMPRPGTSFSEPTDRGAASQRAPRRG